MHNVHSEPYPTRSVSRVDPGAFGVRLGSELRASAEQAASRNGVSLSRWIRRVVEDAVRLSDHVNSTSHQMVRGERRSTSEAVAREFESAYRTEMEGLYVR